MDSNEIRGKDRSEIFRAMATYIRLNTGILQETVLVLGGSEDDRVTLAKLGFSDVHVNEFSADTRTSLDIEDLSYADNSVDTIFIHEVVHHCRSPHRGICEALRVAKRRVIFLEPNDSVFMRLMVAGQFSEPFEYLAVIGHNYKSGGVRDSAIPNYIFRWSAREVRKLVASFLAEWTTDVYADPYWDFNVDANTLLKKRARNLQRLNRVFGVDNILIALRAAQFLLNSVPFIRSQGNKFFCVIEKSKTLKPWMENIDGEVRMKRRES